MTDNTPNSKCGPMDSQPEDWLPESMLEEAAVWQARLRETAPGGAEARKVRADFGQWLLADTRHRQAYAEMETLWVALEAPIEHWLAGQVIAEQSREKPGAAEPSIELSTEPSIEKSGDAHEAGTVTPMASGAGAASPLADRFRSSHAQRLAVAACLVLAVFATLGWQQDWVIQWQSDYVTAVGEAATIETDDGSRITLNTDSAVAMDYNARERRVRLVKGEAWFNVASSDKRPFIVSTDAGSVRVTGTQFNLHLAGEIAIVSLDEGRVELRLPNSGTPDPMVLEPGQQAVLAGNRISEPAPFDRTAVTAWLRGQFVFYNAPLAEVVDTLNRHRLGRIVVTSRELNSLKVSGIFSTDDPDAALEVIASTLPIRQTRLTDYLILIR